VQLLTLQPAAHNQQQGQHHWQQQQQWGGSGKQHWQQQQQQYHSQQQQQAAPLDLQWVSVGTFLADSAIGCPTAAPTATPAATPAAAPACTADGLLSPDCIAGAQQLQPEQPITPQHNQQQYHEQQQQQQQQQWVAQQSHSQAGPYGQHNPAPGTHTSSSSSSGRRPRCMRVVVAIWLPYADDSSQRFWSYKLALRHTNSHALANMALWLKFDTSSSSGGRGDAAAIGGTGSCSSSTEVEGSSSSSSSMELLAALAAQADPHFAGCVVSEARLFVGCPPEDSSIDPKAATAAAAAGNTAAAAGGEQWRLLRVSAVESVLTGSAVNLEVGQVF
jgi:hypothetical protein